MGVGRGNGVDTIFAPASGAGRAASPSSGFRARHRAACLSSWPAACRRRGGYALGASRPGCGEELDQGLVVWFPGPDELHRRGHGGAPSAWQPGGGAAVLRALGVCPAAAPRSPASSPAAPFQRPDGPLGVEGLADLIDAETEAQRRQALRQLEGRSAAWSRLARAADRVPGAARGGARFFRRGRCRGWSGGTSRGLGNTWRKTARHLAEGRRARVCARASRSSSPARRMPASRRFSTPRAARRRDRLGDPGHHPRRDRGALRPLWIAVTFVDTAGLRDTADPIEIEGIARTRARGGPICALACGAGLRAIAGRPRCPGGGHGAADRHQRRSRRGAAGRRRPRRLGRTGAGLTGSSTASRRSWRAHRRGDAVITRERHRRAFEAAEEAWRPAPPWGGSCRTRGRGCAAGAPRARPVTGRVDVGGGAGPPLREFCIGK